MGEWLGALGLAWPRLLLYPGGISALLLAWLIDRIITPNTETRTPDDRAEQAQCAGQRSLGVGGWSLIDVSAIVTPLLLISLLPLPQSGYFGYTPDLLTALALLEWSQLLWLARTWRAAPAAAEGRQHELLQGYLLLLLAVLVLVQTGESFRLELLTNAVAPPVLPKRLANLVAVVAWSIALLLLVGIGSALPPTSMRGLRVGLRLRALGHLLLVALLWLPLFNAPPWLAPLPLALLVAGLAIAVRWRARLAPHYWRIVLTGITAILMLVLGWAAYADLAARLR